MTIEFIPSRLNATPVVFRGMTGKELVVCTLAGLVAFIPVGLIGWAVVGMGAMVPTCMFVGAGLSLWFGGTFMRRLRRGRPSSWVYRKIQWQLQKAGLPVPGGNELIQASIRWRIRRDPVRRPVATSTGFFSRSKGDNS
ncbi:membrane protein [Halomonas cupida]|uniref:Conjugative transfer region protein, TIGR03750 family n=1 Tax=Halomonas cupida TaxID=44933 RepID=A0A1M7DH89_9GAMM|nr:TIGR03750 family conjugal transfer protein [Halomonas cupida]GEN23119.1 membrane protein [Halomonas cupida]SHL78842.1 conjugative transfer region protein, TIGR03750 family [Halomonas cupida]